jgi:hypothetical protein
MEIPWEKAAVIAALMGVVYGPIFWLARRYPRKYKQDFQFVIVLLFAALCLGVLYVSTLNADAELNAMRSLTTLLSTNAINGHVILPDEIDQLTYYAQTVQSYNSRMAYVLWFVLLNSVVLPFAYKLADWEGKKKIVAPI